MITVSNYKRSIDNIAFEQLPSQLQQAHHFLQVATHNFKQWRVPGDEFLQVKELAFKKLQEYLDHQKGLNGKDEPLFIKKAKEEAKGYKWEDTERLQVIYRMEIDAEIEGDATPEESKIRKTALERELKKRDKNWFDKTKTNFGLSGTKEFDPKIEIDFIKKFLEFRNKLLKKHDIKPFIDDLQKAIKYKKIRKHSPYADQIIKIQRNIIYFYNQTIGIRRMTLDEKWAKELYRVIIDYENRDEKKLNHKRIKPEELSGINQEQNEDNKGEIMSSLDFVQKKFDTIGFTGKWLNLIGDPSAGFTTMVFGKPKMGKSFLCIDFAGYLAENFGKVLYVAKEESLHRTLQDKLKQKDVAHTNLNVSNYLPDDLSEYDFIFLDSVNLLALSPEELRTLKEINPDKSFVFVFQTTKTGNFRGANTFQHDVDIVIEIPERGKAVQFGRFNQGGEMQIFEDAIPQASEELDGTEKKNRKEKSKKQTSTPKQFDSEKYADRNEDENPEFLFSRTSTRVLLELLHKQIDVDYLIRRELANRGVDRNGNWVGFTDSYRIHEI